jgi:hypothetical protein
MLKIILTVVPLILSATSCAHATERVDVVDSGALYRSARPTKSDFEFISNSKERTGKPGLGVGTVISLIGEEDPKEERDVVQKNGMVFKHIPMPKRSRTPSPQILAEIDSTIDAIIEAKEMRDHPERFSPDQKPKIQLPVVVHCKHGKDRTGYFMFRYRMKAQKYSATRAKQEMYAYGFRQKFVRFAPGSLFKNTPGLKKLVEGEKFPTAGDSDKDVEYNYPNFAQTRKSMNFERLFVIEQAAAGVRNMADTKLYKNSKDDDDSDDEDFEEASSAAQ